MPEAEQRKIRFLYRQSGIAFRHSVIPDYSLTRPDWIFYPPSENLDPFPDIEARMHWYGQYAAPLAADAIDKCLGKDIPSTEITHLITVSCTGMSAPGLDLQLQERLHLPRDIFRTSVNFMGCYAAIHAMRIADHICKNEPAAKVLIVCVELCTLHFQRRPTIDNIASGLLFADGAAALVMTHDSCPGKGMKLEGFYGEVLPDGKKDMAWEISATGFLMTLSSYVPDIIAADIGGLVSKALEKNGYRKEDISHWCIHPGGKKILDRIAVSLGLDEHALDHSRSVLQDYGNMSSPTILFVLERIFARLGQQEKGPVFGVAFGPGLTMETFTATPANT